MKLIVGLGNIGRMYKDTPHNIGFEFIDALRKNLEYHYECDAWKEENIFKASICKVRKGGDLVYILVKPSTYMNNSRDSVEKLVEKFQPEYVYIAHDDLDLRVGEFKIQEGKGPKGHNGVLSINAIPGSEKYIRIRIGVESREKGSNIPGDVYVLKKLDSGNILTLNETISDIIKDINL